MDSNNHKERPVDSNDLGRGMGKAIAICLMFFGFSEYSHALEKELVSQRLKAEHPEQVAYIDERLFASIKSKEELASLIRHENTSLALRAAWERALRKAKQPQPGASRWRELRYKMAASEFLGFCEGRLQVRVPEYFSSTLMCIDPDEPFGSVFEPQKYLITRDIGNGFMVEPALQVEVVDSGESLSIRNNGETCVIPIDLLDRTRGGTVKSGLSALITKDTVVIASYELIAARYKVKCVKKATGKVLWESEAWGGFASDEDFGIHVVTILEDHGVVFFFGASWDEVYVEGFDMQKGTSLVRFCNAY